VKIDVAWMIYILGKRENKCLPVFLKIEIIKSCGQVTIFTHMLVEKGGSYKCVVFDVCYLL
jgi:hypothetical protein